MTGLLVASVTPTGKTAVSAGIGRKFIEKGKRVGYFKPVVLTTDGTPSYQDAATLKEALELSETLEQISPLHLTEKQIEPHGELEQTIKTAFSTLAAGKDVMIVEGVSATNNTLTRFNTWLAELLNTKVVTVVGYTASLSGAAVAEVGKNFGPRWLGAIITAVPKARPGKAAPDIKALMSRDGVNILGVIPEDRTLFGISVAELAKIIGYESPDGKSPPETTIENIMLGAMTVDSGLDYFSRKDRKAVIVRGDRSDMALAALETDVSCLVLTGGVDPLPVVIRTAREKKVPLLFTKLETTAVLDLIEKNWFRTRFRGIRKIDRMDELVGKTVDFESIFRAVGVTGIS